MAMRTVISLTSTAVVMSIVAACGGGQPPAESPEVTPDSSEAPPPATEPSDGSDAGADTHTMPDGTIMPGSEHGEGTDEHGGHQH
jgi:hypothetical protein